MSIMPCKVLNTVAYLDNRVKAGLISREDADLIYEFCEVRKSMKHPTDATSLVISKCLTQSGRWIAPYEGYTTQDIIKVAHAPGPESAGKRITLTGCTLFSLTGSEIPFYFSSMNNDSWTRPGAQKRGGTRGS